MEKIVYLTGKESFIVTIVSIIGLILLFVPIILILLLRFMYKSYFAVKEHAIDPTNFAVRLEQQY